VARGEWRMENVEWLCSETFAQKVFFILHSLRMRKKRCDNPYYTFILKNNCPELRME
jgi:hypothetical protein